MRFALVFLRLSPYSGAPWGAIKSVRMATAFEASFLHPTETVPELCTTKTGIEDAEKLLPRHT